MHVRYCVYDGEKFTFIDDEIQVCKTCGTSYKNSVRNTGIVMTQDISEQEDNKNAKDS